MQAPYFIAMVRNIDGGWGTPYRSTPVAGRVLSQSVRIRRPSLHLTSVVDAEIDMIVEDRITDDVQVSGCEAKTWEIVP